MREEQPGVLFVDDEKGILAALRRLFIDEEWDLYFALSAAEALEVLGEQRVDLVISDVRMPGMDGIELLMKVKQAYPQTVRILLSGYADNSSVIQAFNEGAAQQVLPKPWNDEELKQVVHNALRQAQRQREKFFGLQKILNTLEALPPMPSTYLRVKDYLAKKEDFSFEGLAGIIEQDISLSAELMRWANSAIFGQRSKVETVKRALLILGSDIVEGLVLQNSVSRAMPAEGHALEGFDRAGLQLHCLATAFIAKQLVEAKTGGNQELADRAFIAGLLHDIGKLVVQSRLPDQFAAIIEKARVQKMAMSSVEQEFLGVSHEDIGSYLAEWWSMPSFIINVIRWHHAPEMCASNQELLVAVNAADALANRFQIGKSGSFGEQEIAGDKSERYGFTEASLESLKSELSNLVS